MMAVDPNKAHTEMMEAVERIKADMTLQMTPQYQVIAGLVAVVEDINEWLCKGGYPPAAWDPFSKRPEGR